MATDDSDVARTPRGRRFGEAWPALAVVAGLLVPLAAWWGSGRVLSHTDSQLMYAPQRWLAGEALRSFRLPLWNPYGGTGLPYLAEAVHGVLHPVSVVSAFLFPGDSLEPLLALDLLLAGLGAMALARLLGGSRPAATAAGLAYGLSGYTLAMVGNLPYLAGAATLPWLVAGLRLAGRAPGPAGLVAAAVGVASAALAGDFQAMAAGVALGLALAWQAGGGRGASRAALGAMLGLGLACVQLWPSWVFLQESDRAAGLDPAERLRGAFSAWRLVEFLSPGFFEGPRTGLSVSAPVHVLLSAPGSLVVPFSPAVHLGAPALLLAGAAWGRGLPRWLFLASLALLWLALGTALGASQLLAPLPVIGLFRFAEKYVGPLSLTVALLAGLGLDTVLAGPGRRAALRRAALGVAFLAAVAWLAMRPGPAAALLAGLPREGAEAVRQALSAGLLHPLAGALALAALLAAVEVRPGLERAAPWVACAVIGLAGAAAFPAALPRAGLDEARSDRPALPLEAPPPGVRLQVPLNVPPRPPPRGWNVFDRMAADDCAIGAPACNVAARLDTFDLRTGLMPRRYELVGGLMVDLPFVGRRYAVTHLVLPPGVDPRVAAAMTEGAGPPWTEPSTGAGFWALPHRAWASFAGAVVTAPGPAEAARVVRQLEEARSGAAVVEVPGQAPPAAPGRVLAVARGLEEIQVEAEALGPSVLVVNDAWAPGWEAAVDGAPVPIWPADVLVRALPFPAGRHVVTLAYRPREVARGAWISAATLVVLAMLAARAWARR